MTLRGPEALASLEEAMRDIRREEDEISRRLARSSERIAKIKESEAELFRQLARLKLDPTVQPELDGSLSAAELRARETLKGHSKNVEKAERAIAELEAERNTLVEQRQSALARLTEKQDALKTLGDQQIARLKADPEFIALRRSAEEMGEIAEQSIRKTEMAEADREQKGKPYRDDPLFMYLWDSGYGTSSYRANNLVRFFDGMVARMVGFHKARPNYAMLNELPLRLREHAERQEENAQAAEARLEAWRDSAVDESGGKPLRDDIARIEAEIEQLDAAIVASEDRRNDAAQALQDLVEGRDPAFNTATAELAAALEREDLKTLLAEARRTRTSQDDTIIAQIDEARSRLREEEGETREQRDRLKILAARRRELEDIQWEFKKQRFDDPRSSFREDKLVGDLLNDFLRGGISAASYWDHWRKSQNWAPGNEWGASSGSHRPSKASPWAQKGGSTFQWPDNSVGGGSRTNRPSGDGFGGGWSGGSSSGGGFSRPRTGSSGTRKHTGFKTGGGF
jgi:hypothetical protein